MPVLLAGGLGADRLGAPRLRADAGWNREHGARRDVEQTLRDAAEQQAMERRAPARPDHDEVGAQVLCGLGDVVRRAARRGGDHAAGGGYARVAELLRLLLDLGPHVRLVGDDGLTAAAAD